MSLNIISLYQNDTSSEAQYYYRKVKKLLEEEREKISQNNNVDQTIMDKPILQDMYAVYERSESFESFI